jgi:serine/threonine-protein kinase
MALSAGTRLGPYEILAPIGAGGMGEVYRARDTKLKRDVALKVLPDSFANDPERMARFQREAEVLASLNHPNIAAIYGVEERALVMELVEGENLKGPLPFDTAINFASQIAAALEAAHDKGIVHRDLKPANIRITPAGVVKVLDFGLAAVAQSATSGASNPANSPTLTLRATEAGFIMGTAAYMSPEQAAGKPVDHRADVWSFGVVLWEMLTGKKLFDGETVSHTLAAVLTKDPDLNQLPAGTPTNIRRLLRRCLERDLKRRLRDMGDAWIELNAPDEPAPALAARKPSAPARWMPWAVAGIAAAAGVGWAWFHTPSAQPRPVIRWTFTQQNPFGLPAISSDGTRLVYTEINAGSPRLMLRMMDQLDAKPIPGTENGGGAVFSPDGQWLVYVSGNRSASGLKKIPVTGGPPISLCECAVSSGVSWGEDGSIVFSDGKSLLRVPEAGGTPQTLTTPDQKKGETAHLYPSVLPGAQAIMFSITSGNSNQVAVLDVKKGSYHVVVNSGTSPHYIPTGHLTFVRNGAMFAVPFDVKRLSTAGSEVPVIEGIAAINGRGLGEYTFSDNGVLVYMAGEDQGGKSILGWVDRKGVQQQVSDMQSWGNGRLSPDGQRIANTINGASASDVWIYEMERRTLTRLTFQGANANPIWTPDSRRVTYTGTVAGKSGIYWVPADGSGKPELLAATDSGATLSSWSPDGKTLVYTQPGADKNLHLFALSVAGSEAERKPVLLHDNSSFSESNAQVSPDGRYLAYVSTESGAMEVYVQPFPGPGPKARISTQGGGAPRWAPSGRELFYWTPGRTALLAVDIQTSPAFRAGLPVELFKMASGTTWDVAPDGKRFLVEFFPSGSNLRLETVVNWFDELRRRVPAGK